MQRSHSLFATLHFAPTYLMAFVATSLTVAMPSTSIADERPNIVLIMADDVGIEGLGCYGGVSYRTPHLDQMATDGVRFTHAYAQPLCTPTRIQLMTGKYNHRNWKSFGILDPREKTFGHAMTAAGYATAIIGKWQLQSYDPPDLPGAETRRGTGMHPKDAGFDEYALYHALHTEDKGSRYANPTMLEGLAGTEGELKKYVGGYGEDVWVSKILDFFDRHPNQPRFVYYPMALPHWPFQPTPNSPDWDPAKPQPTDLTYATEMIEYMDTAVGHLMSGLKDRDLHKNTIVIFYSDNGTHLQVFSKLDDGRTIQGGKATPQQTGIHVPLVAHWPDHFAPSTCSDIVDASDFFPTLLELAGVKDVATHERDGISFAPRLLGKPGESRKSAFFWYDPRPGWDKERFHRSVFALDKNYKLFRTGQLLRLTDKPLEEIPVHPLQMTVEDIAGKERLNALIEKQMAGVEEPPLRNAYGESEHDLLHSPSNKAETNRITQQLLSTAKEISYGDESVAQHRLWIFNPLDIEADELRPCVVFIHGGGWGGNPAMLAAQSVYLQRRGLNSVSIHFRPPSGDLTPADTLRDARRAYRWIVKHGKEHHIDVNNLIVSGGSAGGHLSLALATIGLNDDPVIEHLPKGLVLLNPVIDIVDGWSGGRAKCVRSGIDPQSFSPAHHVVKGLPPVLVLSGSEDKLIPPALLHKFQNTMIAAGNRCEVTIYPHAGHGFFNYGNEQNRFFQPTMWQFEAFVKSVVD
jgi:arylsulfatase A